MSTRTSRPVTTGAADENAPGQAFLGAIVSELADTESACEAFVVLVFTPAGQYRRRVFLSLHGATAAVQRARAKGQSARMVLRRLVPVTADLDLIGEWPT
jgi:hypothetical protein